MVLGQRSGHRLGIEPEGTGKKDWFEVGPCNGTSFASCSLDVPPATVVDRRAGGRDMRKMLMVVAMTAVVGLVATPQAAAITFGEPDGNGHPNVGAMLVSFGEDAVPFCSGSLIGPDVFLTAAHCIVGAEQIAEEE